MRALTRPGRALSRLRDALGRSAPPEPDSVRSLLVAAPGHLGDTVLVWPILAALPDAFPKAAIEVWVHPLFVAPVAESSPSLVVRPWLPRWFPGATARDGARYRPPERDRESSPGAVADLLIDLRGEWQSALATRSRRARYRIGLDEFGTGALYDQVVRVDPSVPRAETLAAPIRRLVPDFAPRPPAGLPELAKTKPGRSVRIGLALEAGTQSKTWPLDLQQALVQQLREELPQAKLVLLGSDADAAHALEGDEDRRCDRTVEAMLADIARLSVLVSADSVPGHMAALLGVPLVSVFSAAGNPRVWGARGERASRLLHEPPDCAGCRLRHCSHRSCLTAITPEMVVAAVRELLGGGLTDSSRELVGPTS